MKIPSTEIRIAFKQGKDGFEGLDGAPLPDISVGAVGEIRISASSLVDKQVAKELLRPGQRQILPGGTRLYAGVRTRHGSPDVSYNGPDLRVHFWDGGLVALETKEAVILDEAAGRPSTLRPCRCIVPALPDFTARSLNHAFTEISMKFETDRISHTGNVFERIFFDAGDIHGWCPLGHLRSGLATPVDG